MTDFDRKSVFVTRPLVQGQAFIDYMADVLGERYRGDFINAPILSIRFHDYDAEALYAEGALFAGVVVSSVHAMTAALEYLKQRPHMPLFCVGRKCADIATEAGVKSVVYGETISALGQKISQYSWGDSQRLLYFRGRDIRTDLSEVLDASFYVEEKIVYDADFTGAYVNLICRELSERSERQNVVLFFSARTARMFFEALKDFEEKYLKATVFLCLSEHVADAVPYGYKVRVAETPDQDGMSSLVSRLYT